MDIRYFSNFRFRTDFGYFGYALTGLCIMHFDGCGMHCVKGCRIGMGREHWKRLICSIYVLCVGEEEGFLWFKRKACIVYDSPAIALYKIDLHLREKTICNVQGRFLLSILTIYMICSFCVCFQSFFKQKSFLISLHIWIISYSIVFAC